MAEIEDLSCAQTPAEYRSDRPQLFPSEGSLNWFMRRYAPQLKEAKAVLTVNRRKVIVPKRFDQVVVEVS